MYQAHPLLGGKFYTWRYTGVTTAGQIIKVPATCPANRVMAIRIHQEGSNPVFSFEGQDFTDSAAAIITSDGTDIAGDISEPKNQTIATVKAISGTINVSCIALAKVV